MAFLIALMKQPKRKGVRFAENEERRGRENGCTESGDAEGDVMGRRDEGPYVQALKKAFTACK